ncbi:MAG TPA: peptidoglycan editing factor PgeF [Actinomycetota bacterium]|nr:peptidoglycan editing factor PgeF [Actinomycetota bacterium]
MTTSWTSPPSSSAEPLLPEGTLAWRPGPPRPGDPEPPWPPVLVAEDLLEAGIVAAFTGRAGGTSGAPFATLNLGLRVQDDLRRVLANRRRVATVLGLAGHSWALARQVHGTEVARVEVGRLGQGPPEAKPTVGEADGLVTTDPGVVLAVLTADCAPVLLADPGAQVVGAVHAGWRGLAAGVVEAGVAAMAELGADPGAVVGLVGPAAGGCCYEVGPEVREAVGGRYPAALATTGDGRPALDPAAGAAQALERAGVGQVRVAGECTIDLEERFFSHRRDRGRTGRQAGLVALVPGGGR